MPQRLFANGNSVVVVVQAAGIAAKLIAASFLIPPPPISQIRPNRQGQRFSMLPDRLNFRPIRARAEGLLQHASVKQVTIGERARKGLPPAILRRNTSVSRDSARIVESLFEPFCHQRSSTPCGLQTGVRIHVPVQQDAITVCVFANLIRAKHIKQI